MRDETLPCGSGTCAPPLGFGDLRENCKKVLRRLEKDIRLKKYISLMVSLGGIMSSSPRPLGDIAIIPKRSVVPRSDGSHETSWWWAAHQPSHGAGVAGFLWVPHPCDASTPHDHCALVAACRAPTPKMGLTPSPGWERGVPASQCSGSFFPRRRQSAHAEWGLRTGSGVTSQSWRGRNDSDTRDKSFCTNGTYPA